MTGSGNSLWVAREISSSLKESKTYNIGSYKGRIEGNIESIGFVFPSYFNSVPDAFSNFIENLHLTDKVYLYSICTHNGNPGNSIESIGKFLKKKGLILHYGAHILMPGNGLLFGDNTSSEYEKRRRLGLSINTIERFTNDIKNRSFKIESSRYSSFQEDRALQAKEFLLKKSDVPNKFYSDSNCNGCGLCSRVCSFSNIFIIGKKPRWGKSCTLCLGCIHYCPSSSINIKGFTENIKSRYINPYIKIEERIDY